MVIEGIVTKVIHRKAAHGSRYLTVYIHKDVPAGATGVTGDTKLTYLQTFETEPAKGDSVRIEGVPLMMRPRKGCVTTNIGAVRVTVFPKEDEDAQAAN